MKSDLYEKLARLDNCIIQHNQYRNAVSGIIDCWQRTIASPNKATSCMLIAEGGLGKTTICKKVLQSFTSNLVEYSDHSIRKNPAFYIQIPSGSTIDSLTTLMLNKLNDINPSSGTRSDRAFRLKTKLSESCTELIIFDEFHHIYSTQSSKMKFSKSNENIANWIKTLSDENKICICLVSLPEYVEIFERDSQQSRRFKNKYILHPLSIKINSKKVHIKPFLAEVDRFIDKKLGLSSLKLSDDSMVLRIYIATAGYHDYVMSLVKEAIRFALEEDNHTLKIQHFSLAWETDITAYVRLSERNPFEMQANELNNFMN
ncbi:TniB family NTP-binding protein [Acinetobacter sp. V91_7]|uniref:TniB family NTP-binding protein n=1 Tax=unclassified Acinetobacter TaxID=196816 RepID=UPI00287F184B|nr:MULTISPECIES: TniB family NTP-binding protein [unclassified Acinetobacter]MDS7935170.1 TniB family NTP-binding protein [Acinetobacter sp. V91_4B]MDS7964006.1 TniB family NTP-binding protein [Acinetobacter sp. V91_7]MDS8027101.1 TniB family NTP-binding protein [Acinetobacter sp. V91_13]